MALLSILWCLVPQVVEPHPTCIYVPTRSRKNNNKTLQAITERIKSSLNIYSIKFTFYLERWCKTRPRKVQRLMRYKQQHSKPRVRIRRINLIRLWCLYTSTVAANKPSSMSKVIFDTDSSLLRIDNCATRSISPDTSDFVTELRPILNTRVQGVGGKIGNVMTGTIRWQIEDDQGRVHTVNLPNSLYVPKATSRLLSPQHWAQTAADNIPARRGTWCATYADQVIL